MNNEQSSAGGACATSTRISRSTGDRPVPEELPDSDDQAGEIARQAAGRTCFGGGQGDGPFRRRLRRPRRQPGDAGMSTGGVYVGGGIGQKPGTDEVRQVHGGLRGQGPPFSARSSRRCRSTSSRSRRRDCSGRRSTHSHTHDHWHRSDDFDATSAKGKRRPTWPAGWEILSAGALPLRGYACLTREVATLADNLTAGPMTAPLDARPCSSPSRSNTATSSRRRGEVSRRLARPRPRFGATALLAAAVLIVGIRLLGSHMPAATRAASPPVAPDAQGKYVRPDGKPRVRDRGDHRSPRRRHLYVIPLAYVLGVAPAPAPFTKLPFW